MWGLRAVLGVGIVANLVCAPWACRPAVPLAEGPVDVPASAVAPPPPASAGEADDDPWAARRLGMVERQIAARDVSDERVLEAMRRVPRHLYVPQLHRSMAYGDHALPIDHDQTISQPYIVALMSQTLELDGSERVLEIGTGSGYQAAVLGALAAEVHSIEIVEPLCESAAALLAEQQVGNVHVHCGDGYQGWSDAAPYDGIMVTAAPEHVPEPLVEQLAPGGRLVIPVGPEGSTQWLKLLMKTADGDVREQTLIPVAFVPMTGEARQPRP